MHISDYHRRFNAVFFLFFLFFFFCIARLLFIQFFRGRYLAGVAKKQQNLFVELEARRGAVFDVNLKPQAVNVSVDSLYASSSEIPDKIKPALIRQLGAILGVDQGYLKDKLFRNKSFVWLARKIPSAESESVRRLNVRGLDFIKESKRCYPNGYLSSHALGFAGLDNTGLEGLELHYNKYLKGEPGWTFILRDARQKKLDLSDRVLMPKDGYNLVLTIDEVIQYIAERELDKAFREHHAKGASIVVMNPHTGAILAIANRPTYDLNEYSSSAKDARRNRAICDMFEPGSVFKIVTCSAVLEEGKVKESDRFFCENGAWQVAGHVLHDHQPHGWLSFAEVIEESSNIGTVKAAQILGQELLYKYARLFGFGSRSGIDLPGEIGGMLKPTRFWSKTSITAVPMGQEVAVTALQLVTAISVIANGGQLMKPYVVDQIRDKYEEPIKRFSPQLVRKVISVDTASRVKAILTAVVESGTGKMAKVPGYSAAGKTGTAQKLEPNGAYSHNKFTASFIGFAPAEDPVIAVAVVLDEPHPYYFGGVVSAPVFKNVCADVLRYLRVKETQNPTPALVLNETNTSD
ncbi:MAG: penicillin-binding transpeptidase domain-containing protein [Candidatus Omnitrophica bacterium]|nr:penicillin-binding transpeptidase domain-containing protein [Candidatus Omnitrophota bacterium]